LGLKHGTPSYSVIRKVMLNINFDILAQTFKEWLIEENFVEPNEFLAIDGKSIRSTVNDSNSINQNFASVVSVYSHANGYVLDSAKHENKKVSEIEIVQKLIQGMNIQGAIITSDALNSPKKL
jgi:hypothetical protein